MTSYTQHGCGPENRAARLTDSTDQHGLARIEIDIRAASDLQKRANSTDSTVFLKHTRTRARVVTCTASNSKHSNSPSKITIGKYPCYPCCPPSYPQALGGPA